MSVRLVFRRTAQQEFDEAARWYERQLAGLGGEFVGQIERVLETIAQHPTQYPIADGEIRGALVHRFPYCIYSRVRTEFVVIIAVFHVSRDPSVWQRRS